MAGSVITRNKHVSSDTEGEDNSSGNTMVVKLEKEEEDDEEDDDYLVACGIQKRRRPFSGSLVGRKSRRISEMSESSFGEGQKRKRSGSTCRWNPERIKFAKRTLANVLKEKGASFESPVSRLELRTIARKKIGDTGLLDHCLKHFADNVAPGGVDRFRRCYNTDGTMVFWLESADLVEIKRESGVHDPHLVPPSWWMTQSDSHESSKLKEEIEKMKSEIKEYESKQKLSDHDDATEKLCKDLMSWRVKTDKQIAEISSSTQSMFKDLFSWKDKVEQQLVGITNSLNNLQANRSTSFGPAPGSWEHILEDFPENGSKQWYDLIDDFPEVVPPDTYLVPPNPYKNSLQNHTWFEENALVNIEMQRTERGESGSSNQEKADMTPSSSTAADTDNNSNFLSQEALKELVTWKAKTEKQLTEIGEAIQALEGETQPNWFQP